MTRMQQPDQRTQAGMLLLPNGVVPQRVQLPVPCPPAPPTLPDPRNYAHLLPGMDPGALRAWVAPAPANLGFPVLIVCADPSMRRDGELNGQAVVLTVAPATGFGEQASCCLIEGVWLLHAMPPGVCGLTSAPAAPPSNTDPWRRARAVRRAGAAPDGGGVRRPG